MTDDTTSSVALTGYGRYVPEDTVADGLRSLDDGLERGLVEPGDVVLFLAAGTGYTWAATVLEWTD